MRGFWLARRLYDRFDVMDECGFFHESNYFSGSVLIPLLHGNLLQHFLQQVPERFYRADEASLCRGVRTADGGSERYNVQVRVFAQDDGTLQAGVVYLHDTLFAVLLFVHLHQQFEQLTVWVRIPSAVRTPRQSDASSAR